MEEILNELGLYLDNSEKFIKLVSNDHTVFIKDSTGWNWYDQKIFDELMPDKHGAKDKLLDILSEQPPKVDVPGNEIQRDSKKNIGSHAQFLIKNHFMLRKLISPLKNAFYYMTGRRYYFVYFKCQRWGWMPKEKGGQSTGTNVFECQDVIDQHPIQFQIECNEKYGTQSEDEQGYSSREEYTIMNWNRLSRTEFEQYRGTVG